MWKRTVSDILLVIIFFLLQCTVIKAIELADVSPNLLIILVASSGFMRGKTPGMLVGFFCGLLVDIFYGDLLGFYAIIYMYIGYANGLLNPVFYDEDIKMPLVIIAISDIVFGIVIYVMKFLLFKKLDFGFYFMNIILPEMIYTIVATILFYRMILVINRWLAGGKLKRSEDSIVE